MPPADPIATRFARVSAAFDADGFDVLPTPDPSDPTHTLPYQQKDGCIGVLAVSRTAKNGMTGAPKKAFYVEGDNYQMGYLMGLLAESDVSRMTVEFAHDIVFDFIHAYALEHDTSPLVKALEDLIVGLVFVESQTMKPDIPLEYIEELQGILAGCQAANRNTQVIWEDLWALNFGIDCLLAHVYSGRVFGDAQIPPMLLRIPLMCNAVFLGGGATGGKHFFGRDFMFSTADVFQDTACMVIRNPDPRGATARIPTVSQTAPGFLGSLTVLNRDGVGLGVDMFPSIACDPEHPGLNSLLLIRDCAEYAPTAKLAVDRIIAAPRGVTWIYAVGDRSGKSCIVEAGKRLPVGQDIDYLGSVPGHYLKHLPDDAYITAKRAQYGTPAPARGAMTRWNDYAFPADYVTDWNAGLWKAFANDIFTRMGEIMTDLSVNLKDLGAGDLAGLMAALEEEFKKWVNGAPYDPAMMGPLGYIDTLWSDRNCPASFYFAPQRMTTGDALIATNMAVTPEMRFGMMSEWNAFVSGDQFDDMQWRYDQLNVRVQQAIAAGPIDADGAWDLANFLRPGPNPTLPEKNYHGPGAPDWRLIQITGSVSLCDLDASTMKSLFGYYGDEPVTITLPRYLP